MLKRLPLLVVPILLAACAVGGINQKRTGTGATADQKPVKTFEQITDEAERGDPEAQFNLGMIYLEGLGAGSGSVQKDLTKARQWLERSAKSGYAKALFNLGVMYYQGTDGVKQNLATARRWFTDAAKNGDRLGQFNLGVMWYRGEGGAQNYAEARKLFEAATVQGYAEGAYNIGVMYAKGEGVQRDTAEAVAWFTIAEAQGNTRAGEIAKGLREKLTPEDRKKASDRAVALAKEIERRAASAP